MMDIYSFGSFSRSYFTMFQALYIVKYTVLYYSIV